MSGHTLDRELLAFVGHHARTVHREFSYPPESLVASVKVCPVCCGSMPAGYALCYPCQERRSTFHDQLADIVVLRRPREVRPAAILHRPAPVQGRSPLSRCPESSQGASPAFPTAPSRVLGAARGAPRTSCDPRPLREEPRQTPASRHCFHADRPNGGSAGLSAAICPVRRAAENRPRSTHQPR